MRFHPAFFTTRRTATVNAFRTPSTFATAAAKRTISSFRDGCRLNSDSSTSSSINSSSSSSSNTSSITTKTKQIMSQQLPVVTSPSSMKMMRNMSSGTYGTTIGTNHIAGTEMMKSLLKYQQEQQHINHPELIGTNVAKSMEALIRADCVCFDVDSTVIQEEGIDVLAEYLGKGPAVAALTKQAMEGGMKFQDALELRLNLLQPSQLQIESCLRDHPFQFTPNITELIQTLQLYHKDIYLISGGFRIMIEPLAKQLNINPTTNVIANTLLFDMDLLYNGFDTTEYTSQDMGKPKAIQSIIDTKQYRTIVMIGDGMTDAQSKPPAATFIGFGGVIVRTNVQNVADWYITNFTDLIHLLHTYCGSGTDAK